VEKGKQRDKRQKWNKEREEESGITKAEHRKKTERKEEINKMQK